MSPIKYAQSSTQKLRNVWLNYSHEKWKHASRTNNASNRATKSGGEAGGPCAVLSSKDWQRPTSTCYQECSQNTGWTIYPYLKNIGVKSKMASSALKLWFRIDGLCSFFTGSCIVKKMQRLSRSYEDGWLYVWRKLSIADMKYLLQITKTIVFIKINYI